MSSPWKTDKPLTTGIGSLPHHNIDAALQFSFKHDIPFLPQIPIRNPKEFMIAQALDGFPGMVATDLQDIRLDEQIWRKHATALRAQLEYAFRNAPRHIDAFRTFEPDHDTWSCWRPFVWELEEREHRFAKIQIAGPITCQWALRTREGRPLSKSPEIESTVYEWLLARSMALVRRLKIHGITPLLFLDEPGLYCYSAIDPGQVVRLNELRLFIQALRKEGALVGLHCCSNTHWPSILSLPLDVLSLDRRLSLPIVLLSLREVEDFLTRGGRFALGVIPTGLPREEVFALNPKALFEDCLANFEAVQKGKLAPRILSSALFTPACGLALHSVEEAEKILSYTIEFSELCQTFTSRYA